MATTITPPAASAPPSAAPSSPAPSSAPETVSSAAELSASFPTPSPETPAEAEPVSDLEEPISPDAEGGEDLDFDTLNEQGNPDEPPAAEEEPAPAPAPEAPQPAVDELPEGVRKGKDRNGKDGYWLQPNRYEAFHQAHKTLREAEALMGEPLTQDALDVRNRAYWAQEKLYGDMLSGDPQAQSQVIGHILSEAQRAQQEGEVAGNPMVSFTKQLYAQLREADPDSYAVLRAQAAADLVDEMYAEAAQGQNRSLWLSAQHFDKVLGRQWKSETEMANVANPDPTAQLRAENERLRAQVSDRTRQSSAAQLDQWRGALNQKIGKTVTEDAITPALASVKDAYANFPESYQGIVDRLHSHVTNAFRQDEGFRDRVNTLVTAARRAQSEQIRGQLAQQIAALHLNKARMVVEAVKAPILREAAERLKAQSDATHRRRQGAQRERAPAGGGTPVQRSLAPTTPDSNFDVATPEKLAKSLAHLFR